MQLKDLGTFRIERTHDYDEYPFDKTYCELVRVKGSKPEPSFQVVSHIYKYSETELALYLKDHKNLWRELGKLLNEDIDISDDELLLTFPVSKFRDISRLIPFVKKRGKTDLTQEERTERINRLKFARNNPRKIEQNNPNSVLTDAGRVIALETFESDA